MRWKRYKICLAHAHCTRRCGEWIIGRTVNSIVKGSHGQDSWYLHEHNWDKQCRQGDVSTFGKEMTVTGGL